MNKGFSFVELIVTMLVIAILGAVTSGMVISVIQIFVYLPNEILARTVAQEAMDIIIEGDSTVGGLRFATWIKSATPTTIDYYIGYPTEKDRRLCEVSWYTMGGRNFMSRSYSALGDPDGPWSSSHEPIPYYARSGSLSTSPPPGYGYCFQYYKADGSEWLSGDPRDIRYVKISFKVTTGTGLFKNWQGAFTIISGVDIKQTTI